MNLTRIVRNVFMPRQKQLERYDDAAMVELVDTRDLKSLGQKWLCGFESRSRHITLKMYTL